MLIDIDVNEALVLLKRRAKGLRREFKYFEDSVENVLGQEDSVFVREEEYVKNCEFLVDLAKDLWKDSFMLQELSEEVLKHYQEMEKRKEEAKDVSE